MIVFWIVVGIVSVYLFLNWRRKYRLTKNAEEFDYEPFQFVKQAGQTIRHVSTYEGATIVFQVASFVFRGGPIAWVIGFLYLLKGLSFIIVAWIISKYNRVASSLIKK